MKKIALVVLWICGLAALLAVCWLLTLVMAWPTWAIPSLFVGTLLVIWIGARLRRLWRNSMLRHRIARTRSRNLYDEAELDEAFTTGLSRLKRSSLGRMGALYALPWVLLVGKSGSGKSTMLSHTRLTSAMRVNEPNVNQAPTAALEWWYLDHAVVLDPAGRIFDRDPDVRSVADWQTLLNRLGHSRRREPLNAIVLPIPLDDLVDAEGRLQADLDMLASEGQRVRLKLDELARVFHSRIPVYVVLTRVDRLSCFAEWIERVGVHSDLRGMRTLGGVLPFTQDAGKFVNMGLARLVSQFEELRLKAGRARVNAGVSLFVPEILAALEPALRAYFAPAFNPGPYTATPLLRGLFVSADVHGADAEAPHNFARAVFDSIIPGDRNLWQSTARFAVFRRLVTHRSLIAWFVLLCALAGLTGFSYYDANSVLATLNVARGPSDDFSSGLNGTLSSLARDATTLVWLDNHNAEWRYRWLPFTFSLRRMSDQLHARFAGNFREYVILDSVDAALKARIAEVSQQGSDELVASYADLLVRRINLLDAALDRRSLAGLPLPGATLDAIMADANPQANYDPATEIRFGLLYRQYVAWQPDAPALVIERQELRAQLDKLSLASRPQSWLIKWANFHRGLEPVKAADLWHVADRPELPRLLGAYTEQGRDAILAFIGELARASGDDPVWQQRRREFALHYQDEQQAAWYEFISTFPRSAAALNGQDQWQAGMELVNDKGGPYYQLLHLAAVSLNRREVPDGEGRPAAAHDSANQTGYVTGPVISSAQRSASVPEWVSLTIRLDRLLTAPVQESGASATHKLPTWLSETNSLGQAVVSGKGDLDSRYKQAKGDLALIGRISQFRGDLQQAWGDIVKGSAYAYQQAANTYAFAYDPTIKHAPLIDAEREFEGISAVEPATAVWPVWALLRGPLDFTLNFVSRSAACTLQDDWNGQVLAPLQGANDPTDRDQLLFASNGLIPSFMTGPAKPFVDRDVTRYTPRQVLGESVPLNGQFYQYVSRAQVLRNTLASESSQALTRQQNDENAAKARDAEIAALGEQINTLRARAQQLEATKAVVSLTGQPVQVTRGATVTAQAAMLSLSCSNGTIELDNYNFPVSRDFNWSQASCGDTMLSVQFPQTTLIKRWPGPRGFIDFLHALRDGKLTLEMANFPQSGALLEPLGVKDVTVSYIQSGEAALLSAFVELDRVQGQLHTLTTRRQTLQAQAAGGSGATAGDGTAPLPSDKTPAGVLPPLPGLLDETSAQLSLPTTIGRCWQSEPVNQAGTEPVQSKRLTTSGADKAKKQKAPAVAVSSVPTGGAWSVRVGVFADPDLADTLLGKLGYHGERERFRLEGSQDELWLVRVTGFKNRADADAAAQRINQGLNLESEVDAPRVAAGG
ncbi:type VI secretion protein IcmF/TssM N-terminal domain-containing protein [Paraburkholderia sediminicola]|uniref:type VI secretion protein IcmF/TssM N-terminal domain-containing protein n=1 Tax=Paraburkholderia sediminicola TaxID=458836 RepID=UPI0038B6C69F